MGGRYQSLSDINTLINSNNKAAAARMSQSKSYGQINQANTRNHKFTSRMSNTSEYDNASNAAVNRTTGNNNNNTNYINNNNDVDDDELVTINGVTGVIVNKDEINNWRGPIPLSEYPINVDPNPIIVHKKLDTQFLNTRPQNVYIRYLRPPTPPPSDIIIQQEKQEEYMEPPPIIIRETKPKNKRQPKEDFIVIREAPPKEYLTKSAHELNYLREPPPVRQMPTNVRQGTGEAKRGRKTIRFLGYNFTLGPRKLIIERRQPSPEKPQSIIVERWLAPTSKQRRAVFRATPGQSAPFGRNSTIRNEKFDQDVVYDEIRL